MQRPNFVYFDLGNVLCFFDHSQSAKQMAEVAGTDPATMRRIVYESDLEHRYESGLISDEEFVQSIAESLGKPLDTTAMLEAASAMFQPNLAMRPVLELLRQRDIPMGILSNTNRAHWDWIVRQKYDILEDWFDPVVLSFEIKAMKPDRIIYERATEIAQTSPATIFFTDDRLDNIQGAREHGWNCLQFVDVASLMRVIRGWN